LGAVTFREGYEGGIVDGDDAQKLRGEKGKQSKTYDDWVGKKH